MGNTSQPTANQQLAAMPNTKSAEKRLRQSEAKRLRNRAAKSAIKTQLRKVRETVAAGNHEQAETEYRLAAEKLDKAGRRHIIHRNKASRIKSRLQRLMKAAKQSRGRNSGPAACFGPVPRLACPAVTCKGTLARNGERAKPVAVSHHSMAAASNTGPSTHDRR